MVPIWPYHSIDRPCTQISTRYNPSHVAIYFFAVIIMYMYNYWIAIEIYFCKCEVIMSKIIAIFNASLELLWDKKLAGRNNNS